MWLLPLLTIWLAQASAYDDLEFLYPDGEFSTPTTANISTYKITNKYEKENFDKHLKILNDISTFLNVSPLFAKDDQAHNPMPAIKNSILQTIKMIERDIKELSIIFDKKTTGEAKALQNQTIPFETESWFQGLQLVDSENLSDLLRAMGAYPLPENTTDFMRQAAIIQSTLLQNTITHYYHDLNAYQNMIADIKHNQLSSKTITILTDHLQKLHEDSHIGHLEITYMSTSSAHIDFEVTVTALTDNKNYITYTNIPYAGYQIKGKFYSYSSRSSYFQLECNHGYCIETPTTPCAEALHRGSIYEVLDNCELEKNENPFKTTGTGIFVFTEPNSDIKEILDDHDLEIDKWPAFITFEGCYSLQHLNIKFNGCLNEKKSVHNSKIDEEIVKDYIETSFAEKVGEYVTNIPMMIALILLPAGTIATLFITKSIYRMCCTTKSKPTQPRMQLQPIHSRQKQPTTPKKSTLNLE